MDIRSYIRSLIPQWFKNFFRRLRPRPLPLRVSLLLSPYLPELICVDVGASYFPHAKWFLFLNSPRTKWLAVEPNVANLDYIKMWSYPCQVSTCTTGLSRNGGSQTLYVTNIDSGSSLLPPEISESMKHRVTKLDYYYPMKERKVDTLTLIQAIDALPKGAPVFVKLDTQGTELSILQGAQSLFDDRRIIGIEMESTMLAKPTMKGSGKFWQACEYLENNGFELLHIDPITAYSRSGKKKVNHNTWLNECDAIFVLRRDVAASLSVISRASLLAFYLTNFFYEEALSLLEHDTQLTIFLQEQGCGVNQLQALLEAEV